MKRPTDYVTARYRAPVHKNFFVCIVAVYFYGSSAYFNNISVEKMSRNNSCANSPVSPFRRSTGVTQWEPHSRCGTPSTISPTRCALRGGVNHPTVDEAVHVHVRVRPFTQKECAQNSVVPCIEAVNNSLTLKKKGEHFTFQFDGIFCSVNEPASEGVVQSSQHDVYVVLGVPLLKNVFEGFNSCLFAYGQTGSGKTYTMMGDDGDERGVTKRLCEDLLARIAEVARTGGSRWTVEVGYVEVYNERVSDLIAPRRSAAQEIALELRDDPKKGVYMPNQAVIAVSSVPEILQIIDMGNERRHTAATNMNDRSSRSHAIIQLILRETRELNMGQRVTGLTPKLNLVDLAGSERVATSGSTGVRFEQARYINLSLTTLGRVIDALANRSQKRSGAVTLPPYRESKLTYLLKDSIGGNSRTSMVATVSPSELNVEETLATLRYASRAREIMQTARINEDPQVRRIRELEEEMAALRQQIATSPIAVGSQTDLHDKLRALKDEADQRLLELERTTEADRRLNEKEKAQLKNERDAFEREMRALRRGVERQQQEHVQQKNDQVRRISKLQEQVHELQCRLDTLTLENQELRHQLGEGTDNASEQNIRTENSALTVLIQSTRSQVEHLSEALQKSQLHVSRLVTEARVSEAAHAVAIEKLSAAHQVELEHLQAASQRVVNTIRDDFYARLAEHEQSHHELLLRLRNKNKLLSQKCVVLQASQLDSCNEKNDSFEDSELDFQADEAIQQEEVEILIESLKNAEARELSLGCELAEMRSELAELSLAKAMLEEEYRNLEDTFRERTVEMSTKIQELNEKLESSAVENSADTDKLACLQGELHGAAASEGETQSNAIERLEKEVKNIRTELSKSIKECAELKRAREEQNTNKEISVHYLGPVHRLSTLLQNLFDCFVSRHLFILDCVCRIFDGHAYQLSHAYKCSVISGDMIRRAADQWRRAVRLAGWTRQLSLSGKRVYDALNKGCLAAMVNAKDLMAWQGLIAANPSSNEEERSLEKSMLARFERQIGEDERDLQMLTEEWQSQSSPQTSPLDVQDFHITETEDADDLRSLAQTFSAKITAVTARIVSSRKDVLREAVRLAPPEKFIDDHE